MTPAETLYVCVKIRTLVVNRFGRVPECLAFCFTQAEVDAIAKEFEIPDFPTACSTILDVPFYISDATK